MDFFQNLKPCDMEVLDYNRELFGVVDWIYF